jgi:hypothetical protein
MIAPPEFRGAGGAGARDRMNHSMIERGILAEPDEITKQESNAALVRKSD